MHYLYMYRYSYHRIIIHLTHYNTKMAEKFVTTLEDIFRENSTEINKCPRLTKLFKETEDTVDKLSITLNDIRMMNRGKAEKQALERILNEKNENNEDDFENEGLMIAPPELTLEQLLAQENGTEESEKEIVNITDQVDNRDMP